MDYTVVDVNRSEAKLPVSYFLDTWLPLAEWITYIGGKISRR